MITFCGDFSVNNEIDVLLPYHFSMTTLLIAKATKYYQTMNGFVVRFAAHCHYQMNTMCCTSAFCSVERDLKKEVVHGKISDLLRSIETKSDIVDNLPYRYIKETEHTKTIEGSV